MLLYLSVAEIVAHIFKTKSSNDSEIKASGISLWQKYRRSNHLSELYLYWGLSVCATRVEKGSTKQDLELLAAKL